MDKKLKNRGCRILVTKHGETMGVWVTWKRRRRSPPESLAGHPDVARGLENESVSSGFNVPCKGAWVPDDVELGVLRGYAEWLGVEEGEVIAAVDKVRGELHHLTEEIEVPRVVRVKTGKMVDGRVGEQWEERVDGVKTFSRPKGQDGVVEAAMGFYGNIYEGWQR